MAKISFLSQNILYDSVISKIGSSTMDLLCHQGELAKFYCLKKVKWSITVNEPASLCVKTSFNFKEGFHAFVL